MTVVNPTSAPTHSFGLKLRYLREAKGWTRKQLSWRAGCAVVTLQKIERDERRPSLELAQRFGQALQLAANEYTLLLATLQEGEAAPPLQPADPFDPTLIGRTAERNALVVQLGQATTRLVTLTGAGGVGKTRLAQAVMGDLRGHFADGVYWVDLSAIHQPALLPGALVRALDCPLTNEGPMVTTLLNFLRKRQLLLVLDHFEQLLAATPLLTDLLTQCPQLTLMVTARSRLHSPLEALFVLEPLALPPLPTVVPFDLAALQATASIALFVARAQAAQPTFALTQANAAEVSALCRLLDGLPLAIELVAARIRLMSPSLLLERLMTVAGRPRLDLIAQNLTTLPGSQPTRQATLRTALAWSYALLSPMEQRAFCRFALFQDGCRLVDAEALVWGDDEEPAPTTLHSWDLLSSLLDKSLIYQRLWEEEPRFYMLETVREYGYEQLIALGLAQKAGRRHAEHYWRVAQLFAERIVDGAQLEKWLQAAEREHANWRAALRWSLAHDEPLLVLRIATALWRFWWIRCDWQEGRTWLEQGLAALVVTDPVAQSVQARALRALGALTLAQGDHAAAQRALTESITLARLVGDEYTEALALSSLATLYCREGAFAEAEAALLQSMAYDRRTGNTRDLAVSLGMLGEISLYSREFAKAITYLQQALTLQMEHNDHHSCMITYLNLGYAYAEVGQYSTAQPQLEAGLHLARMLTNHLAETIGLQQFAELYLATGQEAEGVTLLAKAFAEAEAHALQRNLASLLRVFGLVQLRRGDPLLTIRCFGAVQGLQSRWGIQLDQHEQATLATQLAHLRDQTNPQLFTQHYQTGYGAPTATLAQAHALLESLAAQVKR